MRRITWKLIALINRVTLCGVQRVNYVGGGSSCKKLPSGGYVLVSLFFFFSTEFRKTRPTCTGNRIKSNSGYLIFAGHRALVVS